MLRAYRFALDLTRDQQTACAQHAGTARWAFNHAIGVKMQVHEHWRAAVAELVATGLTEVVARKEVNARKDPGLITPHAFTIKSDWIKVRGDERTGEEGLSPWWREVSSYVFSSAFADADAAWKNWLSSLTGKRKGARVGYPRRKKKFRSRDSFRVHHDVKKPTIRPDGYRRVIIPRLGSLRVHDTIKPLVRMIAKGGVVQSVTVSRGGRGWYASILVKAPADLVCRPVTRRQREAGTIGVDLGVSHLAALSDGTLIENPRHLRASAAALRKAQQALSRTTKGSAGRRKAQERLRTVHHRLAERRQAHLHRITKGLAARYAVVAIEDLNVKGMTATARGTLDSPGRKVRQKAGLNRSILDASPGEFRRQLTYKTSWNGSSLAVCDRWFPSSKTCSNCGAVKAKLSLSERRFRCDSCGFVCDRDVNAARNIAVHAVAPDRGETLNAGGGDVSPDAPRSGGQSLAKPEDRARPGHPDGAIRRHPPP